MSDHVVNIQKIGQHNDIIKISIDKGVEVTDAMPFLIQLLDNCFKNGMYKVIFDMERIKFPSPSFIAFLIEITAQSRRVGGNVILIRLPHSAINNFVTFSPLNYLATEETDTAAVEELEVLITKSKKDSEPELPLLANKIIIPQVEEEPSPFDAEQDEEKTEINATKLEVNKEIEIKPTMATPAPVEKIPELPKEEIKPEKTEKLAVEQNIFRLKEPQLPVKEIISEVAAEEKPLAERIQPRPKNVPADMNKADELVENERTMSRDEVQKMIIELRKQLEQESASINLPDLNALQGKIAPEKITAAKPESGLTASPAKSRPGQQPELNIPAESILHHSVKPIMDQTSLKKRESEPAAKSSQAVSAGDSKKEISQEDKKIPNKPLSESLNTGDTGKLEIREETDPKKPKAFRIRVKSQIESLYKICDFVINLATQAGIPEKERGKLKVTVYEASLNVIEHAYHSDPDEWIVVTVQMDPLRFITIIQDWGESFNFDDSKKYDVTKAVQDRKTGGFGLFIIQRAMDQVQYKTDPLNGNRLILIKNLEPFKNKQ